MKNDKWLYFRTVADEDNENGADDVLCVPASSMVSIAPNSDTSVLMRFAVVKNSHKRTYRDDQVEHDSVVLNVDQGKTFEVIAGIVQTINSSARNDDGFIVVADDATVAFGGAAGSLEASYIHHNITSCGVITCKAVERIGGLIEPTHFTGTSAMTNISAGVLAVNTRYQSIAAATAMTLPSAAATKAGDWITVYYNVAIGNTNAHTYTTTTDAQYGPGSTIRTNRGSHADRVPTSDIAVTDDNIITITGATNGDGGKGTLIKFINTTGATNGWAADVYVTDQGSGVTAATAAFS